MIRHEFSRLAIADRGEPAMRVVHAVRELNHGRAHPIRLIALHTEAERDAAFVRRADEAVCLGPGLVDLQQALRAARADAVWTGSEPVAPPLEIAELGERLGIVFVSPDPAALRRTRAIAAKQEYARVAPANRLHSACCLTVPIVADGHGAVWPLGVSDDSCQRRGQSMLTESTSPALVPDQEREIMHAAERLVLDAGYAGAGTVEFLHDPEARRFYFVRVSARLEHAATETVTGIDLVKLQLHVAMGGRLDGDPPLPNGHAIEANLRAEDPALGFVPTPGTLALLRLPTGPGLRVDTGVIEGERIDADLDPMICKLTAWGGDRTEALARLHRALGDTVAVLDGGTTNQGFLLELLDHPKLRAGGVDSGWLDRLSVTGGTLPERYGDLAVLQAAIELSDRDVADDRARFYALARRGRPHAAGALYRTYELRHRGESYRLAVSQIAPDRYRVIVDRQSIELLVRRLGAHERQLGLLGRTHRTLISSQGDDLLIEVDGVPHRISRDDGGLIR
ncbi:MAG: hypothetical protein JO304_00110, partial [Solirubrobacterales bacterium]|nr:hypothetical protein [Solirubrobacterales bacterium]